uniref:Trafficking protein particle complex subunit 8 n=1 Tax=Cyprinodon variegatus TaxID=28743 RepID=A0A3Q2EAP7_CYPVA
MAHCLLSVNEFIQDSFVPMIAVLGSSEAERVCRKNSLNLAELLRPFCRLTSEGHIRDPNNQLQTVKNLRICINNIETSTGQGSAHNRLLSEVVLSCQPQEGAAATVIRTAEYHLNLGGTTPWFEAYREAFLQTMPPSDHEFLHHYLACLLVVSSSEAVPVEQFLKLSQEQHRIQHSGEYSCPKWFIPNTLKYYVLLHDLSEGDEQRKGLSRSLFTATKKWFGGGKVPEKGVIEPKSTLGLQYPPEAPELQIRKMADLCFLVQHYELAYSCYHTAKKDFLSDQAMLYAAGALEMAAVSSFLQGGAQRPYPAHYMDTAIQTYRDVCKNMVLAERCALLSAEILKSQGKYSEAATLLIKMTSEDSDLRSALLLEQAAHCFINMRNPMVRKFAFHMILAGHRFSKAGQRKHALRCYSQAMQVYQDRGWSLAEDHINFTIGRQSFTLGQPDSALLAFRQILINDSRQTATQQAAFLREYLYVVKVSHRDGARLPELPLPYIHSAATRVYFGHERRLAEGEKQAATHVSLDQEYDQELSLLWCRLEEQLVASANQGVLPNTFQPTQCCLNHQTDNLHHPLAVVQEPIIVEVTLRNPLKVALLLSDLSLLWRFTADAPSGEEVTVRDEPVTTETIREFYLGPEETKTARLKLLPHRTGQLNIVAVVYNLTSSHFGEPSSDPEGKPALPGRRTSESMMVRGRQDLKIQGPRLNLTKEDKMLVRHGPDRRLEPIITPPMPLMEEIDTESYRHDGCDLHP